MSLSSLISFEQIKRANETIATTDIKGKEYAEVNQRIKAFRMVYPTGSIHTTIQDISGGVCIIHADVGFTDESGEYIHLGSGTAYEKENSSFINKTSYIENCETSAVGRALGMAGFGIDVSVASFEEVANAISNQKETKSKAPKKEVEYVTPMQVKDIKNKLHEMGTDEDYFCTKFDVYEVEQTSKEQYIDFCKKYDNWKARKTA